MKKNKLLLLFLLATSALFAQHPTNILPIEEWEEGQGTIGSFIASGEPVENIREAMIGPNGYEVLGWHCGNAPGTNPSAGGFYSDFTVDPDKTYRYAVWMRKNDNDAGNSYLWGATNTTLKLDGSVGGANIFWYGVLPAKDEWFLVVGYIHRSSYTGTENFGGVYNAKGDKVFEGTDFKWLPTNTTGRIQPFAYHAPVGSTQDMFAPRVEVVNGNELALETLMGLNAQKNRSGNLISVGDWNIGNTPISAFRNNGLVSENSRAYGIDPRGESSILWTATASGDGQADGGWNADFEINPNKSYRYVQWVRRNTSDVGQTYFGAGDGNKTLNLNGTANTNPYFWSGDLPEIGKWYMMVGYVHGSGYTGTQNQGGIYDGETGEKVINITDFKNNGTASLQMHRAYFYHCTEVGATQDFWAPRAEALDGNEPTLIELLVSVNQEEKLTGNLLPVENWTISDGNTTIFPFTNAGGTVENSRELGIDPHGETSILWTGTASGDLAVDGGWVANFPVDHTKTYRMVQWVRRNDSNEGTTYFGAGNGIGVTLRLDGTPEDNPYFWSGDLPEIGKWYMMVGYVHGSSYTGTESMGGIYDGITGAKILGITDFKNDPSTEIQIHRAFFYHCTEVGATQSLWGPRAEVIDGNEPTIVALLGHDSSRKLTGNLLPIEDWSIGSEEIPSFPNNGQVIENSRSLKLDPHGETSIVWTATASGDSGADGGWNAKFSVDHTKTYRFVQWIRRNGSEEGTTYVGASGSDITLNLNGTVNANPYFWNGDLPELDKWYLLVGYVHGSGYSEMENIGGIYDGATGEKVLPMTDFKNDVTTVEQVHRSYLHYCTLAGVTQDMWGARAEPVDGNEPTIHALLSIDNGPHIWSEIANGAVYNNGSVGIGVDEANMDTNYKFLVDGDIKTRKVKVTLDGWADHVFEDDYDLKSLEEVEQYIAEHKHLPGVPSEAEALSEAVDLGATDVLLLQKIEELTLYLIELRKEVKMLRAENEILKK